MADIVDGKSLDQMMIDQLEATEAAWKSSKDETSEIMDDSAEKTKKVKEDEKPRRGGRKRKATSKAAESKENLPVNDKPTKKAAKKTKKVPAKKKAGAQKENSPANSKAAKKATKSTKAQHPKAKKRTDEECMAILTDYLTEQNKPFNIPTLVANLKKEIKMGNAL